MKINEIPLKKIERDLFFRFSSPLPLEALKRSVRESGITNPLFLVPSNSGYRIVAGFNRFRVAEELKMKSVPAWIFSDRVPLERSFYMAVLEHLVCRNLNMVEKARIVRILKRIGCSEEYMKEFFLPLLDIPENRVVIEEIENILSYPDSVQNYIERYNLSLKMSRMFKEMSSEEQELFIEIADLLQIRGVELSEIVTMCSEVSKREGISVQRVVADLSLLKICRCDEMNRQEKIDTIKRGLKERRFPNLFKWNEQLNKLRKGMTLPHNVELSWDSQMERPGVELKLRLVSMSNYNDFKEWISSGRIKENLNKMIEILAGVE